MRIFGTGAGCRTLACRLKAGCSATELRPLDRSTSVRNGSGWLRRKQPWPRQQRLNGLLDPQGHGSLRPSFSASSLLPWTTRSPRLTCVSDGKPRRRLLVTSKARRFVVDGFHVVLLVVGLIRFKSWSSGVGTIHRPSPYEGVALPLSYRTDEWSPRSESNGHASRRRFLRPVRLPDSATGGDAMWCVARGSNPDHPG